MSALSPNAKELAALRLFVCPDVTREHMHKLWTYVSDGGATYVATDGDTIVSRRSGTHVAMMPHDVAKLGPFMVSVDGSAIATAVVPPRWPEVLKPCIQSKVAKAYSIDPNYFARLAHVELAAGCRATDDYVPSSRAVAKKDRAKAKATLKSSALAHLTIPSDPLDGWYWRIDTAAALWEGVIMPRRV